MLYTLCMLLRPKGLYYTTPPLSADTPSCQTAHAVSPWPPVIAREQLNKPFIAINRL